MTTASAPRGSMAPVAMAVAWPGATGRAGTTPGVSTSPVGAMLRGASSVAPKVSAACTAKPSTLERSKPGTSTPATTSSPSTRSSAAPSGTVSMPSGSSLRCRRNRSVASSRVTTVRNWVWRPSSLAEAPASRRGAVMRYSRS